MDDDPGGFGEDVPSFFINLLQGPYSYIPGETFIDNNFNGTYEDSIDTPLDTAYNHQGPLKGIQIFPGAKNQIMTAFTHYVASDPIRGDPSDEFEARNYMLGLLRSGDPMDPCDDYWSSVYGGVPCETINPLFWFSGDPESNYGWLSDIPTDHRMLVHTGPFSLEVDKPITIIVGYTIGQGMIRLILLLLVKKFLHLFSSFINQTLIIIFYLLKKKTILLLMILSYTRIIQIHLIHQQKLNTKSQRIRFITLKLYDVLGNEIATFVNEEKPAGEYEVEFNAINNPWYPASGVYFYQFSSWYILLKLRK